MAVKQRRRRKKSLNNPVIRLCARIARDIHKPITEVLQLPATEINYWAAVYREEAGETSEDEAPAPTGRDAFLMLGGVVKG